MAGGEFSGDDEEGKGQSDSAEKQNAQSTAGFGDPQKHSVKYLPVVHDGGKSTNECF